MKALLIVVAAATIVTTGLIPNAQAQGRHRGPDRVGPRPPMQAQMWHAPSPGRYVPRHIVPHRPAAWDHPSCRSTASLAFVLGCATVMAAACPPPPPVTVCPPVVRYVEQPVVVVQPVPTTETVWVQNSNGSRTPVSLRRTDGGMYIGPRGEYYMGLPTNDQLRQLYGM